MWRIREVQVEQSAGTTVKQGEVYTVSVDGEERTVWTKALQRAIDENEVVEIPASEIPYDLDGSVYIDGNCKIVPPEGKKTGNKRSHHWLTHPRQASGYRLECLCICKRFPF